MSNKSALCLLILIIGALLCACGGGTGGGGLTAGGGIGGSGVTVGSASKYGSIFVNDIEFDTTRAVVVVDGVEKGVGDQTVLDNIGIGKIIRIEGPSEDDGTGTANRIVYGADIIGPVESVTTIDANARVLVVMGQTVIVHSRTNIVNTTLTSIAAGDFVEVSGFGDEVGTIEATYFKKIESAYAPGTQVQVRGLASTVNTTLKTFKINQLAIDYATADVALLTSENPHAGQYLEVKGVLAGLTLKASLVEPVDILGTSDADNVEITGIVTEFTSITDFVLNGIDIQTDNSTVYSGVSAEDIGLGSKLTVKGSLTNRILLADSVKSSTQVILEGDVGAVDYGQYTVSVTGLEPVTVKVNTLTRILGSASILSDIATDDHVKVFGKSFSTGNLTADKIIVKRNPSNKAWLRGPVNAVSGNTISIIGFTLDTTGLPATGFSLEEGAALTQGQFVSQVSLGDTVHAKGRYTGNSINWDTLSLQKTN